MDNFSDMLTLEGVGGQTNDIFKFGVFWEIIGQKRCLFGSKTEFLGQEVHYYMVYIAYFTELILQICDYTQKRRF